MNFFDFTYFMCSLSYPDAHILHKKKFLNEIAPKKVFGNTKKKKVDIKKGIFKAVVEDPVNSNTSEVKFSFDKYIQDLTDDHLESSLYKTFNSSNDETISIFIKQANQKLEKAIQEIKKNDTYFSNFPKYQLSLTKIFELLNHQSNNRGGRSRDFAPHDTFIWYHELIQQDQYIKNGKPYLKLIDQEIARLHQDKQQTDSPPDRGTIRRHRRKYNLTQK